MIRLLRYEHSLLQGGGRGSWLTSVWPGTLHTGVMGLGYSNIILKGFGRWTEVCIDPRVFLTAVGPIVLQLSPHTRQIINAGGLCHVPTIGPGIVRRPPKGYLSFNSITRKSVAKPSVAKCSQVHIRILWISAAPVHQSGSVKLEKISFKSPEIPIVPALSPDDPSRVCWWTGAEKPDDQRWISQSS